MVQSNLSLDAIVGNSDFVDEADKKISGTSVMCSRRVLNILALHLKSSSVNTYSKVRMNPVGQQLFSGPTASAFLFFSLVSVVDKLV